MNSINNTVQFEQGVIDLTQTITAANGIKIAVKNTIGDILSYLETKHIKIELKGEQTGPVSVPVKMIDDDKLEELRHRVYNNVASKKERMIFKSMNRALNLSEYGR